MNDPRTRKAIDALAEMLLTGPEQPLHIDAQPDSAPKKPNAERSEASDLPSTPNLRIANDPAPPPIVEAVLLGHLPGYASPWVSQYAADLAQQHGGCILMRIAESAVELEWFDPAFDDDANLTVGRSDFTAGLSELVETLHDAAASAGSFLLLFDQPDRADQRRRLLEVDRWTVLTGANDAAVVGCYRMLKTLLADSDHHPAVSLMFMGCDDEPARQAADRINRAAAEFLHNPIEMRGIQRRMKPVRRQRVGRFESTTPEKLWFTLTQSIELMTTREPVEPAEPVFSLDPKLDDEPEPAPEIHTQAPPPPKPRAACPERSRRERSEAPDDPPAVDPKPAEPVLESPDAALCDHLENLTALQARCPRHRDVELAVDATGRLHLLIETSGSATAAAIQTLTETRHWLTEHRDLIALTTPSSRVDPSQPPLAHLFTDAPAVAAEHVFTAAPDQRPFQLHLLKTVTVAGQPTTVTAPIS